MTKKVEDGGRLTVKVVSAALDVIKTKDGETLVLRGVIDPDSLHLLQVAEYQREILPASTVEEMEEALSTGKVPDIDLGMRGDQTRNVQTSEGSVFYLSDPVFIVDGLQRVTAARSLQDKQNGVAPRLGATIHFNTNEEWERQRFHILNIRRVRVNSVIALRNMAADCPAIKMLIRLTTHDDTFVLCDKVSWQQRMPRGTLVTGVTLLKAVARLHSHVGPGRGSRVEELARGWQKIHDVVGKNILRDNIKTYFEVIEQCWGLSLITYRDSNPQVTASFLNVLAKILSDHLDFWEENRLVVKKDLRKKLQGFKLTDPHVKELCSSSGPSRDILFQMLVRHINSGKRTRHLKPRHGYEMDIEDGENVSEEENGE